MDRNVLPVLNAMTCNGIRLDNSWFTATTAKLQDELEMVEARLFMAVGRDINPGSSQQVSDLLYKELGLVPVDERGEPKLPPTTHGGRYYSTEDKYVSQVAANHEIPRLVLEHRKLSKSIDTYLLPTPGKVDSDGRLRCRWNYTDVVSGRLSSADPNMMNWAEFLRGGFVADDGCKLVSHDLSQIEMRIGAHESQDPRLMHAFHNDLDTHKMTAAYVFYRAQAIEDLTHAMTLVDKTTQRAPCKTVNFGIFYGQTAEGLQQTLASMGIYVTLDWCQWLINEWYRLYEGVTEFLNNTFQSTRRWGMAWDMFGRTRYVPEVRSAHEWITSAGLRQAGNLRIQAGAQGVLKIGMYCLWDVYQHYTSLGKVCRPLLQIHDEMVSEVEEDIVDEFMALGKITLEQAVPLSVPVGCGAGSGYRWSDLK
jgi:DNA polymerase-1